MDIKVAHIDCKVLIFVRWQADFFSLPVVVRTNFITFLYSIKYSSSKLLEKWIKNSLRGLQVNESPVLYKGWAPDVRVKQAATAFHLLPASGTRGSRSGCSSLAPGDTRLQKALSWLASVQSNCITPNVQPRPVFFSLPWSCVWDH